MHFVTCTSRNWSMLRDVTNAVATADPLPAALTARADRLAAALTARLGGRWSVQPVAASGFCSTWHAEDGASAAFVKTLPAESVEVLRAEADGLAAIAATRTIRVPDVLGCWISGERGQPTSTAVLALEWLPLMPIAPSGDTRFGERLGHALAALHRAPPPEGSGRFGWRRDNMIGGTPQRNAWSGRAGVDGWIEFHGRERLGAMRSRLAAAGAQHTPLCDAVRAVTAALPRFFDDGYVPRASLVHGDLWSGNWGRLDDGTPVIFDPAVSCADAEADIAMMDLFGAPPAGFWPAYREAAGLHDGYLRRAGLYRLYHLLNHALLFGGGYGQHALALAKQLLALA
jgi:fructosamine-3-kinase